MNKQLYILLSGRILANFADSFYMIATIWYIKTTTHSVFLVSLTSTVALLPVTLQFLFGPIIDRYSKRTILIVSMMGQGGIVAVMTFLYLAKILWVPFLFVLMFMALSLSEVTFPTENALIEQLAKHKHLTRVNALFSFSYQTLDIIANGIAGVLVAFIGLGFIYLSHTGILFFIALLFALNLKIPRSNKEKAQTSGSFFNQYKDDFVQGFKVIVKQRTLLNILIGIIAINVMATMGLAMLPIISPSPKDYGFWLTAMSAGTLSGTFLASKLGTFSLRSILPIISLCSGLSWELSVVTLNHPLFPYLFFAIAWVGVGILSIYIQSIMQINLPSDYIGIGFAFLSSLLGALSPLGYLLGGILAQLLSGITVLSIAGFGYLFFPLYFLLNPRLRHLTNTVNKHFDADI